MYEYLLCLGALLAISVGLRLVFGYVTQRPSRYASRSEPSKRSDYPTGGEGF